MDDPLPMEENNAMDFSAIWDYYVRFEGFNRSKGQNLVEFIDRWKEKMNIAQAAGCQYSEILLACKLLEKANLGKNEVRKIIKSIDNSSTEVFTKMLSMVEDCSSNFTEAEIDDGASEDIKKQDNDFAFDFKDQDNDLDTFDLKQESTKFPAEETSDPSEFFDPYAHLDMKIEPPDPDLDDSNASNSMTEMESFGTFPCSTCGRTFPQREEVVAHARKAHDIDIAYDEVQGGFTTEDGFPLLVPASQRYPCTVCGRRFPRPSVLIDHSLKNHNIMITKEEAQRRRKEDGAKTSWPKAKMHPCSECERSFNRPSLLITHAFKVHGTELTKEEVKRRFPQDGRRKRSSTAAEESDENPSKSGGPRKKVKTKWHSCPVCGRIFPRPSLLNSHSLKEHGFEMVYHVHSCYVCEETFRRASQLNEHLKRVHNLQVKRDSPTAEERRLKPKTKWHSCPVCGRIFARPSLLNAHSLKEHGVETLYYVHSCYACEKKFRKQSQLHAHLTNDHGVEIKKERPMTDDSYDNSATNGGAGDKVAKEEEDSSDKEETQNRSNTKKLEPKRHTCSECGKMFPRPSLLYAHIRKLHDGDAKNLNTSGALKDEDKDDEDKNKNEAGMCEFCGKEFSKSWLMQHRNICSGNPGSADLPKPKPRNKKPVTCKICGKTFARHSNYLIHLPLHTGEKNFTCEECPASFTHYSALAYHKMKHRGERPYKCDQCEKAFFSSTNLVLHRRREHLNERPFKCEHCEQSFVAKKDLQRHNWHHTGEYPYKCHICGKGFRCHSFCKRHVQSHNQSEANGVVNPEQFASASPVPVIVKQDLNDA